MRVHRSGEIDDPEHDEKDQRTGQRELDNCLATAITQERAQRRHVGTCMMAVAVIVWFKNVKKYALNVSVEVTTT